MLLRDASRTPTFLGLDAKVFAFTFPTLFYLTWWTVVYDLLVVIVFVVLKFKKQEIAFVYRRFRSFIRGNIVSARPWWFIKKWRNR